MYFRARENEHNTQESSYDSADESYKRCNRMPEDKA